MCAGRAGAMATALIALLLAPAFIFLFPTPATHQSTDFVAEDLRTISQRHEGHSLSSIPSSSFPLHDNDARAAPFSESPAHVRTSIAAAQSSDPLTAISILLPLSHSTPTPEVLEALGDAFARATRPLDALKFHRQALQAWKDMFPNTINAKVRMGGDVGSGGEGRQIRMHLCADICLDVGLYVCMYV